MSDFSYSTSAKSSTFALDLEKTKENEYANN